MLIQTKKKKKNNTKDSQKITQKLIYQYQSNLPWKTVKNKVMVINICDSDILSPFARPV